MLPAGACSTAGLVNAQSSPPSTVAVTSASTVTVKEFPSRKDSLNISPNGRCRLFSPGSSVTAGGVADGSAGGGVVTSPPGLCLLQERLLQERLLQERLLPPVSQRPRRLPSADQARPWARRDRGSR